MRTIEPKIPEIQGGKSNGTKIPGKDFSKICLYLEKFSSFTKIPENASFICQWKFTEIKTGIFGRMENVQSFQNNPTTSNKY